MALPGDSAAVPASAPPFPYEGDLEPEPHQGWMAPTQAEPQPPSAGFSPSYDPYRQPEYDDLPALAQATAASQAAQQAAAVAQTASAVQAASAALAAAEAHVAAEDHAAVQAAYSSAVDVGTNHGSTGPAGTAVAGPDDGRPAVGRGPDDGTRSPVRTRLGAHSAAHAVGGPEPLDPEQARIDSARIDAARIDAARIDAARIDSARGVSDPSRAEQISGPPYPADHPSASRYPSYPAPPASVPASPGFGTMAPSGAEPGPISPAAGLRAPLPQRIPAAPDVPDVPDDDEPDDGYVETGRSLPVLDPPELARIATRLRHEEDLEEQPEQRPDGFDVPAILAAVRQVQGVRDAQLRPNPGGVHTLRLDLAEGADPGRVSRDVARLLKQKMGLAAEPRRQPASPPQPAGPRLPAGAAPVSGAGGGLAGATDLAGGPTAGPGLPGGSGRAGSAGPAGGPATTAGTGRPRDPAGMPVAGAAPAPRIPIPTAATEQLGGAAAANAAPRTDERSRRRHPVTTVRGRSSQDGRGEGDNEVRRPVRPGTAPRVILDQVQVSTLGLDATVEVRLTNSGAPAIGVASGPAVDGYVLRLSAVAASSAIDQLLSTVDMWEQPGRCFVEHAAVVPFGSCEVAVVVVLLVCGGFVEQLAGSALVSGDPRQAVVRATLAAVNRRLDALLG
jgi:hypothetical protein